MTTRPLTSLASSEGKGRLSLTDSEWIEERSACWFRLIDHVYIWLDCSHPSINLIPASSDSSNPIRITRNEDFYLTSTIDIRCNISSNLTKQWMIRNETSHISIDTTSSEGSNDYYLPARTLPEGLYQIEFRVTFSTSFTQTHSSFIYLLILSSGIQVKLMESESSMISSGVEQVLDLNPGLYSIDLDEDQFNVTVCDTFSHSFRSSSLSPSADRIGSMITTVVFMALVHFPISMDNG